MNKYQERIKDAIRDYAERHAHCKVEDGDYPKWKWRKKRHCSSANEEREREYSIDGIKHIREPLREVMANLAAKAGRSDPPQREKGDS